MKIAICIPAKDSFHKTRGIGYYIDNLLFFLKKQNIEVVEFRDIKEVKDVDLVHYPFFDFYRVSLPLIKKFSTVVTIHDVVPLLYPRQFPVGIRGRFGLAYQKISLKNIGAVITDSNSSKRDIKNKLHIPEKNIFAIHLAADPEFKKIKDFKLLTKIKDKYNLPEKFVLYVGDVNWNKNLIGISKASKLAGIDIVMVGKAFEERKNLDHPELKSFKKFLDKFSNDPNIHIKGFVPTEDLVAIMNLTSACILASYYEGFGLPILQAQACQTPIITSNLSSMVEVVGDGGLVVDPYDIDSIVSAIKRVVNNKQLAKKLIANGLKNIEKFSWQKTAEETIEVYKYVIHH